VGDSEGTTPLMLAVQKENAYMIKLLMAKKADLSPADSQGNSVYHFAAVKNKDVIEVRKNTQ